MSKDELEKEAEEINITYENNVFHCTKNGTKWISIDGEKWYGEEKRIEELEKEMKAQITQAHTDGYNRGYAKAKAELENKIADIKANCDFAIEGRDVKIMEFEQQVEKMKCCENCKYNSYWGNELHCNYGLKEALQEDKLVECNKMDKWEIKEK